MNFTGSIKLRKKNRYPWYIGDPHFLHANVIKHCDRPFGDVEQMNEALISNWNASIDDKDDVIILGDLFYRGPRTRMHDILSELNGAKRLIVGNHDYKWMHSQFEKYFEGVHQQLITEVYDFEDNKYVPIYLSHYSHRVWPKKHYGCWHLFGHSHGGLDDYPHGLSFDVGVDSWNYKPVHYPTIKQRMHEIQDNINEAGSEKDS